MTELIFCFFKFYPKNGENGPKIIGFLGFIEKFSGLFFSEFGLWRKFILSAVFLHKSHTWENTWDMGQNALGQSDSRIFKMMISPEYKDENAWFFACWYRLMEI